MPALTNPVKAIHAKCVDCCCGSEAEVKLCPCENCPIHPFRLGKNPYRAKREYTEDERKQMAERFAKALGKRQPDRA